MIILLMKNVMCADLYTMWTSMFVFVGCAIIYKPSIFKDWIQWLKKCLKITINNYIFLKRYAGVYQIIML